MSTNPNAQDDSQVKCFLKASFLICYTKKVSPLIFFPTCTFSLIDHNHKKRENLDITNMSQNTWGKFPSGI